MEMYQLPVIQLMYSTAVNVSFAILFFFFSLALQLTMRGAPGPMGLTGRSGPVVSVPSLTDIHKNAQYLGKQLNAIKLCIFS